MALTFPVLAVAIAFAQGEEAPKIVEPSKFYKLDFVVKEVEGTKVLNARAYSLMVGTGRDQASIRAGAKVPIPTGSGAGQYQYLDIGVSIDCSMFKELQREIALFVTADVSTLPSDPPAPAPNTTSSAPLVRQNRWTSYVTVTTRKPTVIFSSDDLTSKRQTQLELTATPIS